MANIAEFVDPSFLPDGPVRFAAFDGEGADPANGRSMDGGVLTYAITEDLALTIGLMYRTIAPMRNRENMRGVVEGIEAMEQEEADYWLGMLVHRPNPQRVLTPLRLLTTPARQRRKWVRS